MKNGLKVEPHSPRKKIVHLLYSGLGGHGSVFFSLVKAGNGQLFDTEAIFCGIEPVREEYISQCETWKVPHHFIQKAPGTNPAIFFTIYKAFRQTKPDIIFLHGSTFIIPAYWYKIFHPKTKLVVRDTQAHHLKTKREWLWLRLAVRWADQLVFLTKESLDVIREKIRSQNLTKKAVIIANGLDTDLYAPVSANAVSKHVVIGMQSRLQRIKDHPALLKAFARLKKRFPGKQMLLRIAGDGETMEALVKLSEELGISHEVEFCGMLNEKQLIGFMHSLDIYVHATEGETMSNSIMQAMSCGLPIVASNVWGVNNMVQDNVNGLLYAPGNDADLCDKIQELIVNEQKRISIAKEARQRALQEYSLSTLMKKYQAVLCDTQV